METFRRLLSMPAIVWLHVFCHADDWQCQLTLSYWPHSSPRPRAPPSPPPAPAPPPEHRGLYLWILNPFKLFATSASSREDSHFFFVVLIPFFHLVLPVKNTPNAQVRRSTEQKPKQEKKHKIFRSIYVWACFRLRVFWKTTGVWEIRQDKYW